jgi:hypothetical protein
LKYGYKKTTQSGWFFLLQSSWIYAWA